MRPANFSITLTDTPAQEVWQQVWDGLAAYNLQFAPPDGNQPLAIFVRDTDGNLVGGFLGNTYWGWLYINILWLDEPVRHRGLGQQLLTMAEAEAVRRGCRHAHLDTLGFQARGFYEKNGYMLFGVLDDLPPGHARYFMKKELIGQTDENGGTVKQ